MNLIELDYERPSDVKWKIELIFFFQIELNGRDGSYTHIHNERIRIRELERKRSERRKKIETLKRNMNNKRLNVNEMEIELFKLQCRGNHIEMECVYMETSVYKRILFSVFVFVSLEATSFLLLLSLS